MAATTKSDGFSAEESAAIKDRAQEVTAQAHGPDGAAAVTKIDKMPDDDKALATRFHQLVREVAPDLVPRTWYGMPAYATSGRNGKVVCFFPTAAKMKTRYNTVGFSHAACLDEGSATGTPSFPRVPTAGTAVSNC